MTNLEAAQILRDHKEWGTDEEGRYMPTLLGQAIDVAVNALEQPEPTELDRFVALSTIISSLV